MATNSDEMYRKSLREKLGLEEKAPMEASLETPVEDEKMVMDTPSEEKNPEADALFMELLQFVHDKDSNANSPTAQRMAKGLWVFLCDNKDKIIKDMVGKSSKKTEKTI